MQHILNSAAAAEAAAPPEEVRMQGGTVNLPPKTCKHPQVSFYLGGLANVSAYALASSLRLFARTRMHAQTHPPHAHVLTGSPFPPPPHNTHTHSCTHNLHTQVLCASTEAHDKVVPVAPADGAKAGERVMVAGFDQVGAQEVCGRLHPIELDFLRVVAYKNWVVRSCAHSSMSEQRYAERVMAGND